MHTILGHFDLDIDFWPQLLTLLNDSQLDRLLEYIMRMG